jgi:hypothetical protein
MLTGKKELLRLQEDLSQIHPQLSSLKNELKEQNMQHFSNNSITLQSILNKLDSLEQNHQSLSHRFTEEVATTTELNIKLKKRIDSFKLLEETARKRLLEETKYEIQKHLSGLSETTKKYHELETNMQVITQKLTSLQIEIHKFTTIAQEIKTADFRLANFASKVTKDDQEKLRLLRENEKLKMLIAKNRTRY